MRLHHSVVMLYCTVTTVVMLHCAGIFLHSALAFDVDHVRNQARSQRGGQAGMPPPSGQKNFFFVI